MLNSVSSERRSLVENIQAVPSNVQSQRKDDDIIILEESSVVVPKEVSLQCLQDLIVGVDQLARFPQSVSPEQLTLLPSQLNEALQREPCFLLEQYQVRILQLKQMLTKAELLPTGERLCSVLKQHLIHAEEAASTLFRGSSTPVQDSLWPLHERILCLPGLEPDFFGAAIATLQEKLPYADSSHPLVEGLQALLPQLLPPGHYLWGQIPPFADVLQKLQEIKQTSLALLHRLKKVSEGYVKQFCIPMETVFETYRSFLEEFNKASDQKKAALCIPKAQLSGVGLGFFSIDRELACALLSRDAMGKTNKKNQLGTHPVHREGGVFYKPNPEGMYYIGPEMEFAIYALYQLLGRNGAAPTVLAKVRHLFFEGQLRPYERVVQAGYGVEGISLQDLLGMANVLPFLECSLGAKRAERAFGELLDQHCEQQFLEAHPELMEEALALLTLEESAARFIQAFETMFESLPPTKRCIEFTELPASNATKRAFYSHISTHSTKLLVGALAFLCRYPDLAITYCDGKVRPASFTEITDLYLYLKMSRQCFPLLSTEQLLQELPQLMKRFDLADFSAHFVVTLLTDPYDHKTDNLMVTMNRNEQGGVDSLSIVGIDNDLAFSPGEEGIKTILYLLPMMQMPFDRSIAQNLLKITPEGLVFDWLGALEEQNQSYRRLQNQGVLTQQDLFEDGGPSLHIPLEIDAELIPAIYAKAQKLVQLLTVNPSETHRDLLKAIRPRLAQAYEKALRTNGTPERAYFDVPRSFTERGQVAPASSLKQTPAAAALSFLKSLDLSSFSLKQHVSLVGKALRHFPSSAHSLTLPGDPKDPLSRRDFFLMAVQKGHCALVARLLEEEKKANLMEKRAIALVEIRNQEEQTALLLACCQLNLEMLRLLIHYGADPQVYDAGGRTALSLCIIRLLDAPEKAATAVRFLGDQTAVFFNAAGGDSGWGPLHHLVNVASGAPETAEPLIAYLIEKGATADLVDNRRKTPLDRAIEQGRERLVEQLIRLGAGRTLNVAKARAFFNSHPHLAETFVLLQKHSLLMRWHIALEAFSKTHCAGSKISIEGVQLGSMGLSPELGEKLLDEHGDIRPTISYGRRNVNKLTLSGQNDLFFKQYPEMPGVEYAIDKLFELLIGHGTSFTDLAKVTLANGKSYPVLISQGIQGENLHDVLSDPIKTKQLEKLDPLAFSELFLASLLVNFEDAKPDNFILELQPNGTYRLVGIDNDHAFVPPLLKEDGSTIQVKCILYCLDQMKQPIHPAARERFLSFTPEGLLRLWLNQLNDQNQRYCTLFSEKERRELFDTKKRPGVVIPIPFKPGAIAEIYQKFQRLQLALKESSQPSGIELLRIVIPSLGIRYEEAFQSYKDPLERFLSLTSTQYSIAIAGRYQTMINSRHMLQSMAIPEKSAWNKAAEQGPTQAIQELDRLQQEIQASAQQLHQIRDALQVGDLPLFNQLQLDTVKEKVINGVPGAFEGIDFSAMPAERQKKVLAAILTGNYRSLRFRGCMALDKAALNRLLRHSPHLLSLELHDCSKVDEKMLVELSQFYYLTHLRLSQLSQLKDVHLPHPTLRRLKIVNCQGLQQLTISHTLKALSIDACWSLSSIEAKLYEEANRRRGPRLRKEVSETFVLQNLHLNACPKLQPWWTMFEGWLRESPEHKIQLQRVPLHPTKGHLDLLVEAILAHCDADKMLAALAIHHKSTWIEWPFSLRKKIREGVCEEVILRRNKLVTDRVVRFLFPEVCVGVTWVDLGGCEMITDDSLVTLSNNCPNLAHLNLEGCYQITDLGLERFSNSHPNLIAIGISSGFELFPQVIWLNPNDYF